MGSRNRSIRRAVIAVAVAGATLMGIAGATPAYAATEESRVSGQGVTPGQIDPNTVQSRDSGASWQPAYVASAAGPHFFDGCCNGSIGVPSTASWINCGPAFNSCLQETVRYRTFVVMPNEPALSMTLRILADDHGRVFINGTEVGGEFQTGSVRTVPTNLLHPGVNTVEIWVRDSSGAQAGTRWELKGTFDESVDPDPDGNGVPDPDGDGDGVPDASDSCPAAANLDQLNTDGDGEGDACDADDDNDGVPDGSDAFPKNGSESVDTDGDGTGNNADTDDDNDGTTDSADAFPLDPNETVDTDNDGTGNNADTDDDNDGLADVDEPAAGTNPLDPDSDDDGVLDGADTLPLDPKVGTEAANAAGICSVVQRLATKHGAAVSLCNHLNKAQKEADKGNVRGFNQAMSTFDKELTAQTNGRNAAFTAANAATVRALAALWTI
jgi:hypothetical protein